MSWRYSTSYAPRDRSSGRDASQIKYGFASPADRQSKWFSGTSGDSRPYSSRNSIEAVEHSPVWAKTSLCDNPASVHRLKERYGAPEEGRRETKPVKRAETKDLNGATARRPYGRSLTLNLGDGGADGGIGQSAFRRRRDATPEADKSTGVKSPLDHRKMLYVPTATTKLLTRKYSNDLSPTAINLVPRFSKSETSDGDGEAITVVTRGTSPTPTTSTVYLRSKRSDYGLEKRMPRPRRPVEMTNKEVQTEREEFTLSKYAAYGETCGRSKPWSSYGDKYSSGSYGSYCSKFSSRRDQAGGGSPGECKRSTSREDSDNATTPESPLKSLTAKPPALAKTPPTSPAKDSEKKTFHGKSPPANIRSSLKLDCAKAELARNPNSPTRLPSPLQCKMANAETSQNASKRLGGQSPKVTIDRCPDVARTIDDVSSLSESSEEETTSEEDADAESMPPAMVVKKSVTNFLQNIPNHLPQNQSRTNLCHKSGTLGPHKFPFARIESGEKAWWLEGGDKTPDGGTTAPPGPTGESHFSNFLSPPYLINRQFSTDRDWLKGSSEDVRKASENGLTKEEHQKRQKDCLLLNGETFKKPQAFGNSNSGVGTGEDNFDVTPTLRRRDNCSKSPENFLAEDTSHQMKFNQQGGEEKGFLSDFPRECSVKDISQKLQNGIGSPLDDKGFMDSGDMSGMISKAKASLVKSKTRLDIKKSSSRETSPKIADAKSEIDLYWKELADSLNRPLRLCDLDFTDLNSDDETDILGNRKTNGDVPPPPPMLILPVPLPNPGRNGNVPAPPTNQAAPGSFRPSRAPAPPPVLQTAKNKKTVKLFWKEVKDEPAIRPKNAEGATLIWDELTQVKVDTQKLEYLFESRAKDITSKKQQDQNKNKEVIVLDPKRSNAINIGMTKLPPPRAIKTAILKMDSTVVTKEGIEKLLTMLPTEEEKLRIQEAQTANPDVPLGSAEQFLLTLASISELEARLRLWAFKLDFENSEKEICEPLMDLKQGMEILRANRTFRGILGTLLSVGNFLNGYDVKGFQIEYLSKVPEVKDTVHKHSLLHHLCIIVMEKFPDSTDLYSEIGAVTRASKVDFDELATNIKKVEEECKLSWNYLKMIAKHEGHTAMKVKMSDFLADCAERIIVLGTVHKRIINRFQKFAFWLGVPANRISTTRPNEIFKIISEFALEYRTTRDRILQQIKKMNREKSRTRGYFSNDPNETGTRKMNSKEAKDDARLKQLLENDTTYSENAYNNSTWRRQRRNTRNLLQDTNNNDEEILETLIKTANQVPSSRTALKERRRSRVYGKHCE